MPNRGSKVKGFITRLVELNLYLDMLPCLKQLEDSPDGLKRADIRFDEMELCTIILNAIPYRLACAYWSKYSTNHFPTSVSDLNDDLVLLEPEFNQTQRLLDQVKTAGGKPSGEKNKGKNANGKRDADQAIPKKTVEREAPKNGGDRKKRRGNKYCSRCAKFWPSAKNTHNTKDCRRFDENGKNLFDGNKRNGNANAVTQEKPDFAKCFAQMQKDNSKLLKLLKKKKAKKAKVVYESDSSDSD